MIESHFCYMANIKYKLSMRYITFYEKYFQVYLEIGK